MHTTQLKDNQSWLPSANQNSHPARVNASTNQFENKNENTPPTQQAQIESTLLPQTAPTLPPPQQQIDTHVTMTHYSDNPQPQVVSEEVSPPKIFKKPQEVSLKYYNLYNLFIYIIF